MMKKFKEEQLKHKARRLSIKEGMFASAKSSLADQYISPFAIAIGSSNSVVALIRGVSGLLGPISQLFGSKLIEKKSRKKILIKSFLMESILILPLIIIGLLHYKGILNSTLPLILLLSFALYTISMNIPFPAWFSWMGDIVDGKFRGRWFSKRTLLMGFVSIVVAISAAFLLDYFKAKELTMIGFGIIFFLGFLARISTIKDIKNSYEPKLKVKKEDYFSFWDFLINTPKNNFGKFALFRASLAFAGSISAPLLAVYLLRNLQFSYTHYMILTFAGTIYSLLVLELWGKIADKYGNYKVLAITAIIIPLVPIFWILHPSFWYLLLIPPLVSGVSWAGFNLAARNFAYDNVSPNKRGLAISYYNLLVGKGVFLGAALGALLIKILENSTSQAIVIIFFIGAFARMFAVAWLLPKVKEIKKIKKSSSLRKMILKEIRPTLHEEFHEIASIKQYLKEK
jgi:MFS family permease